MRMISSILRLFCFMSWPLLRASTLTLQLSTFSEVTPTFLNRARGTPYGSIRVPGTELYFCAHSQRTEKVERLRKLFSRLTLPDGGDFPPGSVEVSIETDSGTLTPSDPSSL